MSAPASLSILLVLVMDSCFFAYFALIAKQGCMPPPPGGGDADVQPRPNERRGDLRIAR